ATLKQPAVEVHLETTADDIPGWDSLSHAVILMNTEKAFDIRFVPQEVLELDRVGDLVAVIERKLADVTDA
ncbi:MAG: hypothetical protein C5B59_15315, partial [Bacteroidetes bacterium]